MLRRNFDSQFVSKARLQGWLEGVEFFLVDVGASGGIDAFWRQFRPQFRAIGFDPLISEVARLNEAEADRKVRYEAAWIGDGQKRSFPETALDPLSLTSSRRAAAIMNLNYSQEYFNQGKELIYSDRLLRLDDFVGTSDLTAVDTIKIDTDGFDYFVLQGAMSLLANGRVLVVECECPFHELVGASWPVFADIDRLMREAGYRLVDLDPYHYTRSDLPGRFMYNIPAQTENGQVQWCDALYILDPSWDPVALERLRPDPSKLWKLVNLLVAFGYADIGASILKAMRKAGLIPAGIEIESALDWLVPTNPFGAQTYADFLDCFERAPHQFYPNQADSTAAPNRSRLTIDFKGLWNRGFGKR